MAVTSVQRSQEAVWCRCEIPDYDDEEFFFRPYIRGAARSIVDDSQASKWVNNEIIHEFDPTKFDVAWIKHQWQGCRGIPDPNDPTGRTRLPGPGLVMPDGQIIYLSDPAQFTEEHKMLLLNARPPAFYVWMQQASTRLASYQQTTNDAQRENFRGETAVPADIPEPQLPGVPEAV